MPSPDAKTHTHILSFLNQLGLDFTPPAMERFYPLQLTDKDTQTQGQEEIWLGFLGEQSHDRAWTRTGALNQTVCFYHARSWASI